MYTKLYFTYFSFLRSRKSVDPKFEAVSIVFLTQVVHFFIILLLVGIILEVNTIPRFSETRATNRFLFLPIAAIWYYLCFHYLRNKLEKLNPKNQLSKYDIGGWATLALFTISFLLPLYILIILSGGQIWK